MQKNGADYVKTQVFDPTTLKPGPWDNDGRREIYEKAKITNENTRNFKYSRKIKINFFTSVMNVEGAKMVQKFNQNSKYMSLTFVIKTLIWLWFLQEQLSFLKY